MTDRLTALDASFLYAERPGFPMHVGSVALFEGGPLRLADGAIDLERIRRLVDERTFLVPRLRQVPRPVLPWGRPYWTEAPFDIEEHVRLVAVGGSGSERDLRDLAAALHARPLDRSRPLWELWFVDGLASGQVALIEKIHHAMVDGIGGVDLAMLLMDLERHPHHAGGTRPSPARPRWRTRFEHLTDDLASAARTPGRALGAVDGLRRSAPAIRSLGNPFAGPRTSLNARSGASREYTVIRQSLAAVKAAGRAGDASVNDVVLAAVAGGLRDLFAERGERVPAHVRVLVPVSLRREDEHRSLGNLVAGMVVPLPLEDPSAAGRLAAVHALVGRLKGSGQVEANASLLAALDLLPEPALARAAGLVHRQPLVDLVVTNVPGPPVPLYMAGARLQDAFPVVPLAGNLTLSVAVLSYEDHLNIGVLADARVCGDVEVFASGVDRTFEELVWLSRHPAAARSA